MPRRNAALSLVAVAAFGLATGCEKPSPIVTITAGGVVVKAHASEYCRGEKCSRSAEAPPVIEIEQGDTLGIDVPRSVSEDGWLAPNLFGDQVIHEHYKSFEIPRLDQAGDIPLVITRDAARGKGEWRFTLRAK